MSMKQITQWYANQTPRDRLVLQTGGVIALLIILVGIFLPLQRNLSQARAQLQTKHDDLAWMKQVAPTLAAAGPGPVASATQESLVVVVERSAGELGLAQAISGTQPSANGGLSVQMQEADFNSLTAWLARLSSQHGVRVESASITGSKNPGVVSATLQLHAR